ncbi:MAG: 50S ribosomal protein L25/general stress protein Ctc [Cellvibrionaceae bacterium]
MSDAFTLIAQPRENIGKGASRRLRRENNLVPAIIYGGKKKPENISLLHKDFIKQLENEAFYSHIITIKQGNDSQDVILKDLQRHPAKQLIIHADFMRVSKTKKLQTKVPLHFINEEKSVGVKTQGGVVSHTITELDISCLPGDLPEYIEVDLMDIEIGHTVHISDIKLPKGVESVELSHGEDHDLPVASISKPKAVKEDSDDAPAEDAAEDESED